MTKLNSRVTLFGLLSLVFAAVSALACALLALGAMGLGTWIAFAEGGSFGVGAAFGAFGFLAAFIGLVISVVQAYAGLAVIQGRKLGFVLGFVFAALATVSGFGGAWLTLAYGLFGLWALWSSRRQFR